MAAREDQLETVVGDSVVRGVGRRRQRQQRGLELDGAAVPAQAVQRAVAGHGGDPRRGVVGRAVARPALEGDEEGLLHRVLGEREVAEDADEGRDGATRLAPEEPLYAFAVAALRAASRAS